MQIKDKASGSPFSGVAEAKAEAAAKAQTINDEIAGLARLQAANDKVYDDDMAAAEKAGAVGTAAYQKAHDAKVALDQDYTEKQKALLDKQTENQLAGIAAQKAAYTSYISGTVNATVNGFDKMLTGQMTWKQLGISIYQSVAREAIQEVEKMATQWIVKHVLMAAASKVLGTAQAATGPAALAATAATSKAQVMLLAGVAGAGGVASMAAAPWPMDMDAPAFGAQMAAAAMSMGSFAQGVDVVPNDMIAQIHAGERIMPAADNSKLMDMASRGAGGGGGGGDTHNHFSPTIHANGADPRAVMSAIEGNFGDFKRVVGKAMRNGSHKY